MPHIKNTRQSVAKTSPTATPTGNPSSSTNWITLAITVLQLINTGLLTVVKPMPGPDHKSDRIEAPTPNCSDGSAAEFVTLAKGREFFCDLADRRFEQLLP